ncbi:MAG: IPTL-CTERM sorting domain-containing protein, partial [Thermoanaerobaculum sp.]|nr:IPTL-CTERM sorting domain-containing protein [Thermoanaerobaculum sp.]
NAGNNTATSGATPVPLVDALNDAGTFPAGMVGATFNVGANDQFGTGSLPGTASFSLQAGTTCAAASINPSTGVVTFNVPASGTCVVVYRVCVGSACDTAQLVVTAEQVEAIPTLQEWGLLALVLLLAGSGVWLARRLW